MKQSWARVVLLALLLSGAAHADVAVPPLTQRVTDLTATLNAQQIQTLESRLAAFEARKGAQLAVLIVPSTQPETIDQFSIRVVEAWKLGRKKVDDGALLLIAKDDHKLRIEVGYGLEGALNDATANRIIDEIIVPRFKSGDFYAGIESGTAAMMQVIDGEPLPPPPARRSATSGINNIESLMFIAFVLVVAVGGMLRALLGRFPAALLMGGALGFLAWLTVAPILIAVLAGAAAFVFVLLGGGRGFVGSGGGGFGGGSGGFGGGGGGFSGGGGGFGGGGASGSW
ncbi:MAG TPA: YgcG family protein [Gallionella sp.]